MKLCTIFCGFNCEDCPRFKSVVRKGGFQGSGDPGPPHKLTTPQIRPVKPGDKLK